MIDVCSQCGRVDVVETWGHSKLCKQCVKSYRADFPKEPEGEDMDVEIKGPSYHGNAAYNVDSGNMLILRSTDDPTQICLWINHEFVHRLLHGMEGLRCCYQYDAVNKAVDVYHGLR